MDLGAVRREYKGDSIKDLPADPHKGAQLWLEQALKTEAEATAFSLATCDALGELSVRVVLAKSITEAGVTFYTNGLSLKGRQLEQKPAAAGVFFWPISHRQLRFEGHVTRVSDAEADEYFASRPHESQVASSISQQSTPLDTYESLVQRFNAARAEYAGKKVPRPAHWGGYRIAFEKVEFWQGQPSRLHQRLLYTRKPDGTYERTWLEP
ncbi:MAG: pyridoxamine 5'-phosphate oxidase [Turneriella sp.]